MTAILVATWTFTAVSCADNDQRAPITVGADSSSQSIVLAEIYSQALARTGLDTKVLTGSQAPVADLDAGRIAVLPARNGALLDRWNPASPAREPADIAAAVNAALPQGLSVSDAADGTDLRARLLVTEEFALRDEVRTVAGLRCAELTAGYAELPGLASAEPPRINECVFAAMTRYPDPSALRDALRDGQVQVGIVNGPPAEVDGLVVLDDADYALRAENVLALFRSGIFDRQQLKKLNYVAGELTTEGLMELLEQVDSGTSPADAARRWLDAHGL